MICKCGSTRFYYEMKGNNTGCYCCECIKWQSWVSKQARNTLTNRGTVIFSEGASPYRQQKETQAQQAATQAKEPVVETVLPCGTCGNTTYIYALKSDRVGRYCGTCKKWQKWMKNKDAAELKARGIKIYTHESIHSVSAVEQTTWEDGASKISIPTHHKIEPEKVDYLHTEEDSLPDMFQTEDQAEIYAEDTTETTRYEHAKYTEEGADGLTDYEREVQESYERAEDLIKAVDCNTCITGVLDVRNSKGLVGLQFNSESQSIIITDASMLKVYGYTEVNYCPTCGRRL